MTEPQPGQTSTAPRQHQHGTPPPLERGVVAAPPGSPASEAAAHPPAPGPLPVGSQPSVQDPFPRAPQQPPAAGQQPGGRQSVGMQPDGTFVYEVGGERRIMRPDDLVRTVSRAEELEAANRGLQQRAQAMDELTGLISADPTGKRSEALQRLLLGFQTGMDPAQLFAPPPPPRENGDPDPARRRAAGDPPREPQQAPATTQREAELMQRIGQLESHLRQTDGRLNGITAASQAAEEAASLRASLGAYDHMKEGLTLEDAVRTAEMRRRLNPAEPLDATVRAIAAEKLEYQRGILQGHSHQVRPSVQAAYSAPPPLRSFEGEPVVATQVPRATAQDLQNGTSARRGMEKLMGFINERNAAASSPMGWP